MPFSLRFLAVALVLVADTSLASAGLTETSCAAGSASGSGLLQLRKGRLSDEAVVDEIGTEASRSVSIHVGLDNYPVFEWRQRRLSKRAAASGLIARKRTVDRQEHAASFLQEAVDHRADADRRHGILATLSAALDSVPHGASIEELSTDLHGHDFAVVQAVGPSRLKRVGAVTAEVWGAKAAAHNGLNNSLHQHWVPYMQLLGFAPQANCTPGREEADGIGARDCTFVRSS